MSMISSHESIIDIKQELSFLNTYLVPCYSVLPFLGSSEATIMANTVKEEKATYS